MIYGLLTVIIVCLCIKIYLLKKSAKEISEGFAEKLKIDTNTLINLSSNDKDMRKLAASINTQLKILRKEHYRYTLGDTELKNAVTNISHDLRTPLTAICGYLDIIKRIEKSEQLEKYLEIITDRTEIMKQLTEELFKYSIILSASDDLEVEDISLNQALEDSIMGYYAALNERSIVPQIDLTDQKIVRRLNAAALSRIFSNLLNNAIKYSDGDLHISLSDSGVINFTNTAKNLTPVQVEHLFDRFYTVETARNSTGLGLSIARKLVEQMNGSITAKKIDDKLSITLYFDNKF